MYFTVEIPNEEYIYFSLQFDQFDLVFFKFDTFAVIHGLWFLNEQWKFSVSIGIHDFVHCICNN